VVIFPRAGVQVSIWGDTKEIAYCSGFGFHDFPKTCAVNAPNLKGARLVSRNPNVRQQPLWGSQT